MVVYYRNDNSDLTQLERLSERVEVHKWKGEKIKCDKIFFNYSTDIIDYVEANEYIWMVHMNYKSQNRPAIIHPKITKCCGVSKEACRQFEELSGRKCELLYNVVKLDTPKKVLKLISATRLTPEKGRDEMVKLGNWLNRSGIPYIWLVFTDSGNTINNPNMIFMPPRLDITSYIKEADYLVQLSNSEAFCFSVVEAEMLGIPCIVRELPVWEEIGLKDRENCFILDYYVNDVPVDEIYKGLKDFKYIPPKSDWDKYLDNNCEYDPDEEVKCRALVIFDDVKTGERYQKNQELIFRRARANRLLDLGLVEEIKS